MSSKLPNGATAASAAQSYSAKVPYDALRNFSGLALAATNYLAVVANPSAPLETASEMITWAKANPGKLAAGTNSEGGYPHLAFEYLTRKAGLIVASESPEWFDKFIRNEYAGYGKLVHDIGLKPS